MSGSNGDNSHRHALTFEVDGQTVRPVMERDDRFLPCMMRERLDPMTRYELARLVIEAIGEDEVRLALDKIDPETHASIRAGMADAAAGRVTRLEDAFDDLSGVDAKDPS